tara:strand:- start:284 stop:511 length:228 start_codon:yes stop_codon:yes gene_type:complete
MSVSHEAFVREAVRNYANYHPIDLKTPREIQLDLLSITGDVHCFQPNCGDQDLCNLCGRHIRNPVHARREKVNAS